MSKNYLVLSFPIICLIFTSSPSFSQNKRNLSFSKTAISETTRALERASSLRAEGSFEESRKRFDKLLKISQATDDQHLALTCYHNLGIIDWNLGNLDTSYDFFASGLALSKKIGAVVEEQKFEIKIEIHRLYAQGKDYRASGEYEKSTESFQKAIDLSKKINSPEHELKSLRQLSAIYWLISDYTKFSSLNQDALDIARELKHSKEISYCLNNIGLYYWKIDNYSKSLEYFEEALAIADKLGISQIETDSLNNMGIIYKEIGNYDKALEYSTKALELDQLTGNPDQISIDLNNIGATYRKKGLLTGSSHDYEKALKYFNKYLQLVKTSKSKKTEIGILNNIGTVYSDLKKFAEAISFFKLALALSEEIKDRESASMIYNNMGIVQFNLGNFEESTKLYQKAIDLALEFQGGQVLWEAYLESANAYKKHQLYTEALQNYKNSISVIENIRSSINLEEYKATYLGVDKRIEAYQNIIDLLYILKTRFPDRHYDQEAFDYLEKAKARAFLDSLEVSSINVSQGIDMKLSNREKEIARDISKLYTKLLMPELSDEERETAIEQLKGNEEKYEELKREIRATSPAYANLRYPKSLTYKEVERNILDPGVAYFCYSIGKENSYGFVLSKRGLKMFPISPRQKIQNQVIEYRKAISDKENRDFRLGKALFEELVQPGLDQDINKIIIIPDDVLNMLPFETLITDEKNVHWLIQDYSISYAPSISSLRELDLRNGNKRNQSQKDIIAFGDPYYGSNEEDNTGYGTDLFRDFYSASTVGFFRLRFSGLETQKISSLFKPAKRDVYLRESASEEQLKSKNLADYKIIHFATHGLIDDKKPARSSIILSLDRDPTEDGFLQMREIINLNMHADLVTLSACQTGLGQFIRGEGIEGLSRAFFYAGASSVLMSLWAVNDEATYQLMERFYYHLRSSRSLMNALRIAKLEMINSSALSHPYYWAGFIISGKTDRPVFPRKIENWLLLASSLCVGAMIFFVVKVSARRHNKNREQRDML